MQTQMKMLMKTEWKIKMKIKIKKNAKGNVNDDRKKQMQMQMQIKIKVAEPPRIPYRRFLYWICPNTEWRFKAIAILVRHLQCRYSFGPPFPQKHKWFVKRGLKLC